MKGRDLKPPKPDTRPTCSMCANWTSTTPFYSLGMCARGGDRNLGPLMFGWHGRGCPMWTEKVEAPTLKGKYSEVKVPVSRKEMVEVMEGLGYYQSHREGDFIVLLKPMELSGKPAV